MLKIPETQLIPVFFFIPILTGKNMKDEVVKNWGGGGREEADKQREQQLQTCRGE